MSEESTGLPKHQPNNEESTILLAKGILETYEPTFVTIKTHLKELTDRQELVLSKLTSERKRLEDVTSDAMSDALIANVAINRGRLVDISNSMMSLHRRMMDLQERAARIDKIVKNKTGNT